MKNNPLMVATTVYHPMSVDFLLGREYDKELIENNREQIIQEILGFKIAIQNMAAFIKIIKKSRTKEEANEKLAVKFNLTSHQCEMILSTKLTDITKLNLKIIQNALASL